MFLTIIQGRNYSRGETIQERKLFNGGNYSRKETINYKEVLTAETIQRRKLFKGGNYMRKYGNLCSCLNNSIDLLNYARFLVL